MASFQRRLGIPSWGYSTYSEIWVQEVMKLQLLVDLDTIVFHLLLLLLGQVVVLPLDGTPLLHLIASQTLPDLKHKPGVGQLVTAEKTSKAQSK